MPLMPKSTAAWLIENTALTFDQIAAFCQLHKLEIQSLADQTIATVSPFNPVDHGQLTNEEIKRCEANAEATLTLNVQDNDAIFRKKDPKYIPRAKRQDRPSAILWIINQYPDMPDKVICDLLGTTKSTVESIRNKSYKSYKDLSAQHPVKLGLCSQVEFDATFV